MLTTLPRGLALAAAFTLSLTAPVQAGGLADTAETPVIVASQGQTGSAAQWLVPLIFVGLVIVATRSGSDSQVNCAAAPDSRLVAC